MPRAEILAAIARIYARTGQGTFALGDLLAEMTGAGVAYAESTVQVWLNTTDDIERVDRGTYRLRGLTPSLLPG